MKYGVRDICDVVLRAKARMQVGNKIFYKDEPVIYFDTLTTSSLEGAATTTYAQGGRGNTRLMSWDGERTVTFNMTDALISPESFMILSGAGLIEATQEKSIKQHVTEKVDINDCVWRAESMSGNASTNSNALHIPLSRKPYLSGNKNGTVSDADQELVSENVMYVMLMKHGEIISEPYIPVHALMTGNDKVTGGNYEICLKQTHVCYDESHGDQSGDGTKIDYYTDDIWLAQPDSLIVDYYVEHFSGAKQITITGDSFGGNFYLEASTLFRNEDGVDMPAEFIIPNCRIQGNFTFTMSASGDPSTFDFVMDAFPDYTRWDKSKKVLAALQVFESNDSNSVLDKHRGATHQIPQSWYEGGADAAANEHENIQELNGTPPYSHAADPVSNG